MSIGEIQAYIYFGGTAVLVYLLYAYLYHLYTAKKREGKDYETYSDLVLHDNIDDALVEKCDTAKTNKE
jgi:cytochrome c oxidase cbb3-type subunit IV